MNKRQKLTLILFGQLLLISGLILINFYNQIKISTAFAAKFDYPLVRSIVNTVDISSNKISQLKSNYISQTKSLPLIHKLDIWGAQINSVTLNNTNPTIDDTISLNMSVKNTSNQLASFKYIIKVVDSNNNQLYSDFSTIYDIPMNGSKSKIFYWKVNLVGNFKVLAEVWDPGMREKFAGYTGPTYTAKAKPFISPSISRDNSYINPSTIKQGDTFTCYFNVTNQNTSQAKIGLGTTIRNRNTLIEYYDTSGDTTTWINSGTHTVSRSFRVPDNISTGDYEYVFTIWSEFPPSGTWYGSTGWKSPLTIQAKFQNPSINNHYILPTIVNKNETFTIYYYVYNPNSSIISVGLGASIRKIGVYNDGLSDPINDKIVNIPTGYSWQSRSFKVPSDAQSGVNEYIIKLWSSTPGSSTEYAKTSWTSGPTIPQAKGSLTATIKNVGSIPQTIPGSDGLVKLYTSSGNYVTEKTTTNANGKGQVVFDNLTPGDYYIKIYYQKGPWGAEYWGQSSNQTVPEGGPKAFEFTRNNPYMTDINFYRGETNTKVDVNSTLLEGDQVRTEIDIYNPLSSDVNLTNTLVLDQSQNSLYDFEESKTLLVSANSSKKFIYNIYPAKAGIYYRSLRLQLSDGSITDGWNWHEAFKVAAFPPEYNSNFIPSPLDGQTKVPNIVDLKWDGAFTDPENKPITYDLFFGKDKNSLSKTEVGTVTTYQVTAGDFTTQYWWKVIAKDSQGLFTSSPLWNFTTDRIAPLPIPQENISAGEDKIFISGMMGTLTATVNDPYFRTLDYQWTEGYTTLAFGQTLNYTFSFGEHNVTLHVLVNGEEVGSDNVKVNVINNGAIQFGEISYVGRSVGSTGFVAPTMVEPLKIMSGITESYRISLINFTNNEVEVVPNSTTLINAGIVTKIYDEWGQTVDSNWKIKMSPKSFANFRITIEALTTQSVPKDTGAYLEVLRKSNNTVLGEKYLQVKLVSDSEWFNQDLALSSAQVGAIYDYLIGDLINEMFDKELPAWRRCMSFGLFTSNFVGVGEIKLVIKTISKDGLQVVSKEMARKEVLDATNRAKSIPRKEILQDTIVDAANRHVYATTMGKEASYNAFAHYGNDSLVLIDKMYGENKIKKSTLGAFINRFKDADDVIKKNLLNSLDNLATNQAITQDALQQITEKLNQDSIEILSRVAHDADAVNAVGNMLKLNKLNTETIDNIVKRLAADPKIYGLDAIKSIEKLTQKEIYNDWRFIDHLTRRFAAKPMAIESVEKISAKLVAQSDVTDSMFKNFVDNALLDDSKLADLLISVNSIRTAEGEFVKGVITRNNGNSFLKDVMYKGVRDVNNPDPLIRFPGLADSYFTRATYKAKMTSELMQEGKKVFAFHQHGVIPNPKNSGKPIEIVFDALVVNDKGLVDHYAFIDKTVAGHTQYFTEKTLVPYTGEVIDDFKQVDKIFDLYGDTSISARQYTQEFDAYANVLKNGGVANSYWVVEDAKDSALQVFKNRWGATVVGQSGTKKYLAPLAVGVAYSSLVKPVTAKLDQDIYKDNNLTINGIDVSGSQYILVNGSIDNVQYDTVTGLFSAQVNLVPGVNTISIKSADVNGHESDVETIKVTYDPTAPEVYANHAGGTFNQPVEATLHANEEATIYYTLDGTEPTINSPKYTNPITINQTTTLKYFAVDIVGNMSAVQTDEYIIIVSKPNVPKVTIYQPLSNQLKQVIKGTKDPNTSLIMVQETVNVRHEIMPVGLETNWQYEINQIFEGVNRYLFYSVNSQGIQSDIVTISITRDTQAPIVKVQPAGGTYTTAQKVTLSSDETTAEIIVTTGDDLSARRCVGSCTIDINQTTTLKYYSIDSLGNKSGAFQENYIISGSQVDKLVVSAKGSLLNNIGPEMIVKVGDQEVLKTYVNNTQYQDFSISVPGFKDTDKIFVMYTNDASSATEDRNLYIDYIKINDKTIKATQDDYIVYDRGSNTLTSQWVSGGLKGEYYNNMSLNSAAMTRIDPEINYDWGWYGSPDLTQIRHDAFSARWIGKINVDQSGDYTFYTSVDDYVKLYIDGNKLIEDWPAPSVREKSAVLNLSKGLHDIQIDFAEAMGGASIKLWWSSSSIAKQIIPSGNLYYLKDATNQDTYKDNQDMIASDGTMKWNGALKYNFDKFNLLEIKAKGTNLDNVNAKMSTKINNQTTEEFNVDIDFNYYLINVPDYVININNFDLLNTPIDLIYSNDQENNLGDRNLFVDYIKYQKQIIQAEDLDRVKYIVEDQYNLPATENLYWNGNLKFNQGSSRNYINNTNDYIPSGEKKVDLIDSASQGDWYNSLVKIQFGQDGMENGTASIVNNQRLEDDSYSAKSLYMNPDQRSNGTITGFYKLMVPNREKVYVVAKVGYTFGKAFKGDGVNFNITCANPDNPTKFFAKIRTLLYDNQLNTLVLDISDLKGQNINLMLGIHSRSNPDYDLAIWQEAYILVDGAIIIKPTLDITTNNGQDFITNQKTLTINGTTSDSTQNILVNGSNNGINYTAGQTNWSYQTTLNDGDNTFSFIARNNNGDSVTKTIKIRYELSELLVTPSIKGGNFDNVQSITLNSNRNAKIYYTLDGTNPSINSKIYKYAIRADKNITLKFMAVDQSNISSRIFTENYVVNLARCQAINLIKDSWKMISVSSELTDLESAFGENYEVFEFDHILGKYQRVTDKLVAGKGYWVKVKENQEIHLPVDNFNLNNFPSTSYNQGFVMISGEYLKHSNNLKFSDGTTTKNLAEAINAGWVKYMAYYYDNDIYNGLDLRSITSDNVMGRSFWLRFYKPLTISFDGSWQSPPQQLTTEIPKIN